MSNYIPIAIISFAASLGPTIVLVLFRRRLGLLNAASWLVIWGVVIAITEHGGWAIRLSAGDPFVEPHARVHFFMAGVYAVVGGVMLGVIARTLLLEGRRAGWYSLLFASLVGGTIEIIANGPKGILFQHGLSTTQSLPQGTALFGYLFAWLAALVLAYTPIFRSPAPGSQRKRANAPAGRA